MADAAASGTAAVQSQVNGRRRRERDGGRPEANQPVGGDEIKVAGSKQGHDGTKEGKRPARGPVAFDHKDPYTQDQVNQAHEVGHQKTVDHVLERKSHEGDLHLALSGDIKPFNGQGNNIANLVTPELGRKVVAAGHRHALDAKNVVRMIQASFLARPAHR
jgi:hypothetical protein